MFSTANGFLISYILLFTNLWLAMQYIDIAFHVFVKIQAVQKNDQFND